MSETVKPELYSDAEKFYRNQARLIVLGEELGFSNDVIQTTKKASQDMLDGKISFDKKVPGKLDDIEEVKKIGEAMTSIIEEMNQLLADQVQLFKNGFKMNPEDAKILSELVELADSINKK
jgi:hypothetical protein